ncbi:hypothetical protein BDR05DRAFT_506724 [Suillus weaverae]|nr:hypothetical protein BDR05DRAFT_506724 [Suillus weaverae]
MGSPSRRTPSCLGIILISRSVVILLSYIPLFHVVFYFSKIIYSTTSVQHRLLFESVSSVPLSDSSNPCLHLNATSIHSSPADSLVCSSYRRRSVWEIKQVCGYSVLMSVHHGT